LAGYIFLVFGLVVYSFSGLVNRVYPRMVILLLITSSILFINSLEEDNLLYLAIVSRLVLNDSTGKISGDNRTDAETDAFFDKYRKSSNFFFGLGNETTSEFVSEGGAGYKVFLIRFGLISALFVFLFYFAIILNYKQYEIFCLFLLLMLLLSQNAYPFWFCVVFTFILGIPKLYNKKDLNIK
jgi:hypothetical protein